jgi:hypothetical protein
LKTPDQCALSPCIPPHAALTERFRSLVFPLVGSRADFTTAAKTSSASSNWTTTGVTNATFNQEANQIWRRSSIPMSGNPPAKGFLRLEFEK